MGEGSGGGPARRGRYHHGDLAASLVDAGRDQLAETGMAGFSVAEIARRVGFDVIFAPPLRALRDEDLARAGRAVMEQLVDPAMELVGADGALRLVEQVVVLAHGYATLDADGFLAADRVTTETTGERSRRAAPALIDGVLRTM